MIDLVLSPADVRLAEKQAALCAMGGKSQLRADEDRQANLLSDQVLGQAGTIALHRYWFGDLQRYMLGRYFQNRSPWEGDGGEDIPAANVDVKTSRMRRSQDPITYNLLVRPRERHAGWVYALALVGEDFEVTRQVTLVGWATDEDLPQDPEGKGPFEGAYRLPAAELRPFPPIRYDWFPVR